MTVTYLVAITTDDSNPQSISETGEDIMDDLEAAGHLVESVHPWARPNLPSAQPGGGFTSLDPNNQPPV